MDYRDLEKAIKDLKDRLHAHKDSVEPLKAEIQAATKEADEAYKLWAEKKTIRHNKMNALKNAEQKSREISDELKQKEHELFQERIRIKENQDRGQLFNELDELTRSAKWREWAFDYQIEGAKILAVQRRGFLGDKRGSGKTLTSNIWLDMVQAKKVLIVIPKDVITTFEGEIEKWSKGRTIVRLQGKNPIQREIYLQTLKNLDEFVVTINYQAWRKDKTLVQSLISLGFDTVICDEAHEINKMATVQAKGVKEIVYTPYMCPGCQSTHEKLSYKPYSRIWECAVCSERMNANDPGIYNVKNFLAMSGTWMLNRPQELFTNLHLIDRDSFPSEAEFLKQYCWHLSGNNYTFKAGAEDYLFNRLGTRYIARKPQHTLPPVIQTHELDFEDHPQQAAKYKQVANHVLFKLEDGSELMIPEIITLILRLRQMTSWPSGIVIKDGDEILYRCEVKESVKIDKAEKLAKELIEEGERVIIFSQFKTVLKELESRLGDKSVRFDGDTSDYTKELVKQDFHVDNKNPRWSVCLANYKTGGVGLNLNGASHVIMVDREWNPGKEDQAIGRVDRIGQTQQVNVHILQVTGSIDTWMDNLIAAKDSLISGFEGRGKQLQEALLNSLRDSL